MNPLPNELHHAAFKMDDAGIATITIRNLGNLNIVGTARISDLTVLLH